MSEIGRFYRRKSVNLGGIKDRRKKSKKLIKCPKCAFTLNTEDSHSTVDSRYNQSQCERLVVFLLINLS